MNEKYNSEESKPPSSIFDKIKKYFRNPFFIKTQSVSEVTDFLKDAVDQKIIDKEAESIASKAIKLGDITVKEIMIPKVDMVTIQIDENTTDVITKIIESGHSRYPVLGSERDEVVGILLAKDILPKLFKGVSDFQLTDMLREANVVPESKKADSLLEEFKQDRRHLAVVIDEYGSISGLITIEDILEELVGEIEDEHDTGDVDELIQVSPTEYIADARLDINVFEKKFDLKFDDLDAETVGGLFIHKLGLLPKVGDRIEVNNMTLAVTAADKRKVKKIGITINKPTSD